MTFGRRDKLLVGVLMLIGAAISAGVIIYFWPGLFDVRNRTVNIEHASYKAPLVITVEAFYPGADAQTVADAVAAPIEEQVAGVEQLLSMSSQSANDGTYTLRVTFKAGTDPNTAQQWVNNRASLSIPALPALVQNEGITVHKKSPLPVMFVNLVSQDARYDLLYLSNYATINVKDELFRLPGVGGIVFFGPRDSRIRLALDAESLRAMNLTVTEVLATLAQQNLPVAAEPIGQPPAAKDEPFKLTINLGQLIEPEKLGNIIVKAAANVRLKDVARVELDGKEESAASLDGKRTVMLAIHPLPDAKPSDVTRAVIDRLKELWANAPAGIDYKVVFAFAPVPDQEPAVPEHLVIDVQLPDSASLERTIEVLERGTKILLKTPGIAHVEALTEHPFSLVRNRPCLVVVLDPRENREDGREQIAAKVRAALQHQIPEAAYQVSVPSIAEGFPIYGFPIDFAIEDRGDYGSEDLRQRAEAMVVKMNRSGKFSDVGVGSGLRRVPVLRFDIARDKCRALGVELKEISNTLQVLIGSNLVNGFNEYGRTWQISVKIDPQIRNQASEILHLQVRNKQNQLLTLGTVMDFREAAGRLAIERHNMYPRARITANLAAGANLAEAKSLCESLATQEFGIKNFKLTWPIP